jgi:Ca2+-binding EF-hand superfamily protein
LNLVLEDEELNKKIESVEKNENGKVKFEELVKSL